jgi:hypothetical protein
MDSRARTDCPRAFFTETQDEIDQIMSEIEELQQEMNAVVPSISQVESVAGSEEILTGEDALAIDAIQVGDEAA